MTEPRDFFAAEAMKVLLNEYMKIYKTYPSKYNCSEIAKHAFVLADEMILQREEITGPVIKENINGAELIVTFLCDNNVHIYTSKSSVKPMQPYQTHKSKIHAAEFIHLIKGIPMDKIKIITN